MKETTQILWKSWHVRIALTLFVVGLSPFLLMLCAGGIITAANTIVDIMFLLLSPPPMVD